MDGGRRREDVARLHPGVPTGPVGHAPARLEHEQRARGDVPRVEAELEEAVEGARRRPRKVERGGARAAQVLEPLERLTHDGEVAREKGLVAEGKAGGDDGAGRIDRAMQRQALAVAKRAA